MRWLLAGLLFALAVALAIGSAAIRAENALRRHAAEQLYREIHDRRAEYERLAIEQLDAASPEQLALAMWAGLEAESRRRGGSE